MHPVVRVGGVLGVSRGDGVVVVGRLGAPRGFDGRLLRKARGVNERSYVPSSSPRTNMPPWGDVTTRGEELIINYPFEKKKTKTMVVLTPVGAANRRTFSTRTSRTFPSSMPAIGDVERPHDEAIRSMMGREQ